MLPHLPRAAAAPLPAAPKAGAAFTRARPALRPQARASAPRVTCMASSMQFIKGIDEPTIPEVKLTRSRDGASGTGESATRC
jgi:hypothetical protein